MAVRETIEAPGLSWLNRLFNQNYAPHFWRVRPGSIDLEEAEMRAQRDMQERGRRLSAYAATVGEDNVWWRNQVHEGRSR